VSGEAKYRDYLFKLIAGFTVFAGLLGFLAETIYREFFDSIIKLAQSEEYSYIIVSFFTVFAILYLTTKYIGFSYGVRLSKIVFTVALSFLSIAIHSLARVELEHRVQLMGLSFVCIFVVLLLLIYEPNTLNELVVFLTPLLLIPLPARFVDFLTPLLSRYIGKLAGVVTGARIIETPGFIQLEVISASGEPVRLSVEAVCTGIVTMSSILAIIPLLLYIATFSIDKPVKKILISLLSLTTALLIGLIGNFVRILLVVYATMRLGAEHAYTLFHYSPSLVYSTISVLVAFYIMRRYLKFKALRLRGSLRDITLKTTWEYIAGVLLLSVITVSVLSIAVLSASSGVGVSDITVDATSISEYLQNPAKYLSTSKLDFTSSIYDSFLTRVLSALAVYRVSARSQGELYTGYIEVVDTPARLHTWELCLTLQGYFVKASWSSDVMNVRVNFIVIERGNWRGVLAYTLFPVIVRTTSGEYSIYTRISLLSEEASNITDKLSSILLSVILEHSSERASRSVIEFLNILSQSSIYILSVFLVYFVVVLIYKYRVRGVLSGWRIQS